MAGVVAAWWIPLAASLTEANVADGDAAAHLADSLPAEVRFVLGDHRYPTEKLHAYCLQTGRILICSRGNRKKPADDPGRYVRRVFHKVRSLAIENWNEQFKSVFERHGQVPTKGKTNTWRFALGAVFLYQLTVWYRFEHGLNVRAGIKAFLKVA